ncbi:MAG: divergent PAP2 family protein [Candidatus Omnitrophica bacterium]|nr:divergent PAP2 family protein [Candidatus Omnitrophota bacterium]
MRDFIEFGQNYVFWTGILGWFVAQSCKVLTGVIIHRRFDFRWFVGSGGMPSSHAAGVSALSTSIGLIYGFDSAIFALSLGFALVVFFDAQGVRRSSGKQAVILNKMLDDIYWKKKIDEKQIKELLGHSPIEVLAGAALGVVVALMCYK